MIEARLLCTMMFILYFLLVLGGCIHAADSNKTDQQNVADFERTDHRKVPAFNKIYWYCPGICTREYTPICTKSNSTGNERTFPNMCVLEAYNDCRGGDYYVISSGLCIKNDNQTSEYASVIHSEEERV